MFRVVEARPEDCLLEGHNVANIILFDGVNAPSLLADAGSLLSLQQHFRSLHVAVVVLHEADHDLHREQIYKLLVQFHLS